MSGVQAAAQAVPSRGWNAVSSGFGASGTSVRRSDADEMGVFVDRLAAAGSDRATAAAAAQLRRHIDAAAVPPGIRKLAEALAAAATAPPAPRLPVDAPDGIVEAMNVCNLVVLADHTPAQTVQAVAALVRNGRRVVVTGADERALAAARSALPGEVTHQVCARLPAVSPVELRELRRLLVGETPARRARADQQLPTEAELPAAEQVAALCRRARGAGSGEGSGLLTEVLAEADDERLAAISSVARFVYATLGALGPRHQRAWLWDLLADLLVHRHREAFDTLCEETAQAVEMAESLATAPSVGFLEPLSEDGLQALLTYHEYLQDGRRPRAFFRSVEQREVQPVLARIRVGGQVPETVEQVELIVCHRELAERIERIERFCAEIGLPPLRTPTGLPGLSEDLRRVAAAARSTAALRHDVLFLRPDAPIPPPDAAGALQIAGEILAFAERAPAVKAGRELQTLAEALAATAPAPATAPEHEQAVAALRVADPGAYAEALDALDGARREQRDGLRQADLLARLRSQAPAIAAAWTARPDNGFGFACFTGTEALLTQLPPTDSADVVVVLGAGGLGVERLLLAAVAPRMVAVADRAEAAQCSPNMLAVLGKAGALTIRGGGGARAEVVPLPRSIPPQRTAQVG